MVPGSVGWAAVGAVVAAWDMVAIRTGRAETLSSAFGRGCTTPAGRVALTAVCVCVVAHLEGVAWRHDPFRLVARVLAP